MEVTVDSRLVAVDGGCRLQLVTGRQLVVLSNDRSILNFLIMTNILIL